MSSEPLIKGLAIYNSKSGLNYYYKYFTDVNFDTSRLTSLICLLRGIERLGNESMDRIGEVKCGSFVADFKDNVFKIIDKSGVFDNIHFHDFKGLSGLFSVSDTMEKSLTKKIFQEMVKIIKARRFNPNAKFSKKVVEKLDKKLEYYFSYCADSEAKSLIRTYV